MGKAPATYTFARAKCRDETIVISESGTRRMDFLGDASVGAEAARRAIQTPCTSFHSDQCSEISFQEYLAEAHVGVDAVKLLPNVENQ